MIALFNKQPINRIMWIVNVALAPAGIMAVLIFGLHVLGIILVSIASAVVAEAVIQKTCQRKVTVSDGSVWMTGLLLSYNLPPHAPFWLAAVGSVFAIVVAKQAFGGFGKNIFNPALAGRAFLMAAWPNHLASFSRPFVYDAVAQATPLALLKEGKAAHLSDLGLNYWDLLIGHRGGSLGEVCIIALLLGGLYLLYKRIISWHIPVSFIAAVGIITWIFGAQAQGFFKGDLLFHILSGGLMLGAVYMATDPVTSPAFGRGQLIFGAGCGLLTSVIRIWGGYPEGVCYAILLMNAAVPLIDRFTKKR